MNLYVGIDNIWNLVFHASKRPIVVQVQIPLPFNTQKFIIFWIVLCVLSGVEFHEISVVEFMCDTKVV